MQQLVSTQYATGGQDEQRGFEGCKQLGRSNVVISRYKVVIRLGLFLIQATTLLHSIPLHSTPLALTEDPQTWKPVSFSGRPWSWHTHLQLRPSPCCSLPLPQFRAQTVYSAASAQPFLALQPLWTALWALLFLREPLRPLLVGAACLIVCGAVLASTDKSRSATMAVALSSPR